LLGDGLESYLVLADEHDEGSLIEVPEGEGLTDARARSSDNDSLVQEIVLRVVRLLILLEVLLRGSSCKLGIIACRSTTIRGLTSSYANLLIVSRSSTSS